MCKQQKRQAKYYVKNAKNLPELSVGDTMRIKPAKLEDKVWKKGIITRSLDNRSYIVATSDGATYRCNRIHLEQTKEPPPFIIQRSLPPMKSEIKSPEPKDKKQRYEDILENKPGKHTQCSPVKGNTKSII